MQGEWIEILLPSNIARTKAVSPHAGRVDWNTNIITPIQSALVSPHAGRVD